MPQKGKMRRRANGLMKSPAQDPKGDGIPPRTEHRCAKLGGTAPSTKRQGRGLGENGVEDEHVCQGGSGQAVTGKGGAVEFIPLRRLAGILRV